jgi:hypothetical protein
VIARVMSKFAAAYTDAPAEWYDFLSWGVAKGAGAPVDDVMTSRQAPKLARRSLPQEGWEGAAAWTPASAACNAASLV